MFIFSETPKLPKEKAEGANPLSDVPFRVASLIAPIDE